jgi:hypothetical protein
MRHISKEKRIMNELTSIKFVKCGNCPESCEILWDCIVCLVSAGLRFTPGSVDGTVKSVWFQQVFSLLRVQ